MRDLVNPNLERIRIDSKSTFNKVSKVVKKLVPAVDGRVEYYVATLFLICLALRMRLRRL